ncbi:hypothetical protein [Photobacterium rosenbergii]|uniref:hypothetical protein n=1 Tax=Photobacterium rosenbergii TaxID=294936 RepID=UPI001C98E6D8|nr:hypothetical protein [Photobacterium rosenbergii]MBY5945194.1 hypothetical protein [Photobacterium rosenbergii]
MVILLNGSINSGKTTIGKALCRQAEFAFIEVDSLRECVRWMELEQSIELNLTNAAALARNFDSKGINSVIAYPLSHSDLEMITGLLADAVEKIIPIALTPSVDVLQSNRGNRELNEWEKSRIGQLTEKGISYPTFGYQVDNSNLSVDETVRKVLDIAMSA